MSPACPYSESPALLCFDDDLLLHDGAEFDKLRITCLVKLEAEGFPSARTRRGVRTVKQAHAQRRQFAVENRVVAAHE